MSRKKTKDSLKDIGDQIVKKVKDNDGSSQAPKIQNAKKNGLQQQNGMICDQIVKKARTNDGTESLVKQQMKEDKILGSEFYGQGVVELAQALLGKILVRKLPEGEVRCMIVETEAYKAPEDKACHAYNNKKTDRTKYFWLDGGHLYVFSIYVKGNNYCINIVASTKENPEAVLIRAVEPVGGIEIVKEIRKTQAKNIVELSNGPGKVGSCLGIDKQLNGYDLRKGEDLYLVDNDQKYEIESSKRINIDYAEEWVEKKWRFTIKNNKFVSKVKQQ